MWEYPILHQAIKGNCKTLYNHLGSTKVCQDDLLAQCMSAMQSL